MNYLMMPPQAHYDCGLGITASHFYDAANVLKEHEGELLDDVLPVCYLQRHAIELFLKSLIYILHKKYGVLFGKPFSLENPGILLPTGKSIPMFATHDIASLYQRFLTLFLELEHLLPNTTNWEFPEKISTQINLISGTDPKSTYFRYPISTTEAKDLKKSRIQKTNIEAVLNRAKENGKPTKTMVLLDENDNIIESYNLNSDVLPEVKLALNELCDFFQGAHCAFRCELTKGF